MVSFSLHAFSRVELISLFFFFEAESETMVCTVKKQTQDNTQGEKSLFLLVALALPPDSTTVSCVYRWEQGIKYYSSSGVCELPKVLIE